MINELGPFVRLFRRHSRWMVLGTLLGLATVLAGVGLLSLAGWFISAAAFAGLTLTSAHLFNIFYPSIGVRLFAITRVVSRYAERVFTHDATFRILAGLRTWFYRRIEPLAPARLSRYRSADILNRVVADIDALDNLYLRVLSPSLVAAVMLVIMAVFLGFFDRAIAGAAVICLFAGGFGVSLAAGRAGSAAGGELARRTALLRIRIVEGLQGLAELLVFGAHPSYLDSVAAQDRDLVESQRRLSHIQGAATALITLFSGLAVTAAVYIGADRVNQGWLDGANLALIAFAVLAAFEAMLPLPGAYQYLGRIREGCRRLLELVAAEPLVQFPRASARRPKEYSLRFEGVSFRYQRRLPWVLRHVDFVVSQGRRLVVTGQTGVGKSTLIHLLARFWDPVQGRILIGGRDIATFSEADLRRLVAVVPQDPYMFNASLRDNLLLADPGVSEQDLWEALEAAQLKTFVGGLPDGLDTWVGETGQQLSGGQIRRLAVARAIVQDAPIWVLDEPTEGLDAVTQRAMMRTLDIATEGKTVLLITHRRIGLRPTDKTIELQHSRII